MGGEVGEEFGPREVAQLLAERQAVLTQLIPVLDWPVHRGGWDKENPKSLAFRVLGNAIAHGTFDMAFPLLSPLLLPEDQTGRDSLVFSILMEREAGNPVTDLIHTDLKQVGTPEIFDYLMLWAMWQLVTGEGQHYGAISPLADPTRTLPAHVFRERERETIRQNRNHPSPEALTEALNAFDEQLKEMMTHPWLAEHHARLYDAFRVVRPHVAEHLYLAEERQNHAQTQSPDRPSPRRRRT